MRNALFFMSQEGEELLVWARHSAVQFTTYSWYTAWYVVQLMFQKPMQNRFFYSLLCFYFMYSDFIYQLKWNDYLMYSLKYEEAFSLIS